MVGHRGMLRARNRSRGNKGLWKKDCPFKEVVPEPVAEAPEVIKKPVIKKRLFKKKE